MIAVVDYKKGNLLSVERGLRAAGADARITASPAEIADAAAIVLPGVGAFADAMETMNELGQTQVLKERLAAGVPFLGICLGLHLLFEAGTEGASPAPTVEGLGILPGVVDRMPREAADGTAFKVPHVGWNTVQFVGDAGAKASDDASAGDDAEVGGDANAGGDAETGDNANAGGGTRVSACPLFSDIDDGTYFYFTHSYISPANSATVAQTTHSVTFPCTVQKGNVFGTQFHPEKSSDAGAKVLQNFVNYAAGVAGADAILLSDKEA